MDGAPAASERPAPGLGQHTGEILRELGLQDAGGLSR
jgi:crotonobetainyl-CoA:carnitine CoA-transferase CaiB-like acyl-CoA transferase